MHERNLDMLDFIKIKIFYHAKEHWQESERQATGKKKYLQKLYPIKGHFQNIQYKSQQ